MILILVVNTPLLFNHLTHMNHYIYALVTASIAMKYFAKPFLKSYECILSYSLLSSFLNTCGNETTNFIGCLVTHFMKILTIFSFLTDFF